MPNGKSKNRTTGDFKIFDFDTSQIQYKTYDAITKSYVIEQNTAKTLSNLSKIVRGLENTVRSATGEKGFNINRNLVTVDPASQVGHIRMMIKSEYENVVNEALKYFQSSNSNILGEEADKTFAPAIQDAVKIDYRTSKIHGTKAINKMLVEADKAGGYASALPPTKKSPERMTATLFTTQSEANAHTDAELFNEAFPETLKLTKVENKRRKIAEKDVTDKEVQKYFDDEEKAKRKAEEKKEKELEKQEKEDKKKELNWIKVEQKDADKKEREQEKEDIQSRKAIKSSLLKGLAILGILTDITRRILTAVISRLSEVRKQAEDARVLGMSATAYRDNNYIDVGLGLEKGTTNKALGDIQSMFGDVTKLNTDALGILARVIGENVSRAVKSGMGGENPEKLNEMILNGFFKNFKEGRNSLGQQVGRDSALRELTTVLREVSPNIASEFASMANAWLQGNYQYGFDDYAGYRNLSTRYTGGVTSADYAYLEGVGQSVFQLKKKFMELKDEALDKLSLKLGSVIDDINNWNIGKSASEQVEDNRSNKEKMRDIRDKMRTGLSVNKNMLNSALGEMGAEIKTDDYNAVISAINHVALGGKAPSNILTGLNQENARKILFGTDDKGILSLIASTMWYKEREKEATVEAGKLSGDVKYKPTEYSEGAMRSYVGDVVEQRSKGALTYSDLASAYMEEYKINSFSDLKESRNSRYFSPLVQNLQNKWIEKSKDKKEMKERSKKLKSTSINNDEYWNILNEGLTTDDIREVLAEMIQHGYFIEDDDVDRLRAVHGEKVSVKEDINTILTSGVVQAQHQNASLIKEKGYTVTGYSAKGEAGKGKIDITLNVVDPSGRKSTINTEYNADVPSNINQTVDYVGGAIKRNTVN